LVATADLLKIQPLVRPVVTTGDWQNAPPAILKVVVVHFLPLYLDT
jgi:hypothetical protein